MSSTTDCKQSPFDAARSSGESKGGARQFERPFPKRWGEFICKVGRGKRLRSPLNHPAEVDAFLGELLSFLGGRGRLRIKVGMLRSRQDGADVLAIGPRDAGNPTPLAVLNSLDVVLLVRNHDSRTQLTLTDLQIARVTPTHNRQS